MKKLIVIMGKTASSKDTICRYIKENYGISMLVSNTTRSIRDTEVNGKEHWFLSDEEFDKLDTTKMFAYTKFPKTNSRYCATIENMSEDIMTYILNPNGLTYLDKKKDDLDIDYFSIFCHINEDTLIERARTRGDKEELILKRIDSERDEFDNFYENKLYDYCIETNNTLDYIYKEVDRIMLENGYSKQ